MESNKDDMKQEHIPMRLVLASQQGNISTMWLPGKVEGHYKLPDGDANEALPFYVESEDEQWIAHLGKGAEFVIGENQGSHTMPLSSRMIARIQGSNEKFILYIEAERPGDYEFLPYYLEDKADYVIGRQSGCHIYYPNDCVSREHAILHWQNNAWYIIDQNSVHGTYVNGRRVKSQELHNGDFVFIMGLYILMGSGFVSMNNANNRVQINTPKIRRIFTSEDVLYPNCPTESSTQHLFERQPRKRVKAYQDSISIDMPPMPMSANKIPLLLRMGSPLVMGGQALITGNIVMTLTSLVFPALTQGLTEKDRKEYEAKRTSVYREYLSEKEKEILTEKRSEEKLLNEKYPNLTLALDFAVSKKRLWERRKSDDDFLSIRIGSGAIPMIAKREYNEKRFELERDVLAEEMYALAERPVLLNNAPVMLALRDDYVVGIPGSPRRAVGLIRNIIIQLALSHSYDEVKMMLLVEPELAPAFDFVRYLPHTWDNEQSIRFFVSSRSDASQISEFLSREIEPMLDNSNRENLLRKNPSYVIFALSKDLFDCVEILKEVMFQEEYCGVSILAAFDGIPKECSQIIDLNDAPKIIDLYKSENAEQAFTPDSYESPKNVYDSMRELMRTKLIVGSQAYTLPNKLSFLEMYHAGKVSDLNPLERWEKSMADKSLSARVGIGTDGRLFTLDLHEKYQGPHGLVAGMTGSGKSEFLITYILSMAVTYSPEEVAFILIDYKGGGLADAFEDKERGIHLPHLAGTITNLDGASIQRSLMSIKSELMRRQTVFKEVKSRTNEGTLDIYDYQRLYRDRKVSEPMPHLFIISDEFAELKQQQPDFMEELISAARIGRSLGVHLILATQKPSGVVNDQIWSNTKFRVCLRVQDRGDSMEMLKRPEAAELKHTGRFYLQVGYNEYFALGQSAWCGAEYVPQDEPPVEKDSSVQFIDNVGQSLLSVRPETEECSEESVKQIVAIVQELSETSKKVQEAWEAAKALGKKEPPRPLWGMPSSPLWVESLPHKLELDTLLEAEKQSDTAKGKRSDKGIWALLGMVDDPEKQKQFPLYLNLLEFHNMLLVGTAGSGKSTLLRTMLYSLLERYSPEEFNYYIVDLSNGMLNGYSRMPHCGAYLTEKDDADVARLLNFIRGIIDKRKRLFAEAEATSFEAYCHQKAVIPLILFIVDGYTNIKALNNGDEYFMVFQDYLREGSNFGVRFVLTCNHTNEVSARSKQELDYRIALQAKDHYEYSDILDVRCKFSPPEINGRGMCVQEGRPLAYQTAMLDCDKPDQERASLLRERLSWLTQRYKSSMPAERLPMADANQSYRDFCTIFQSERFPLGYSRKDMKPVAMPFQQLHSVSLYFGNPKSVAPVFQNLLVAAEYNHMDTVIVRRQTDSVFDDTASGGLLGVLTDKYTLLESTEEGLSKLAEIIMQAITERNVLRDDYSVQQGIPLESKGRSKKAIKYIRAHSSPILVIMESLVDFCKGDNNNPELQGKFTVFFEQMRGYNIYFAAGFYPDDDSSLTTHQLMKCFNKEEFLLLFSGRYDRFIKPDLPFEVKKLDMMDPLYNRFLMKYQEVFYPMVMPCGELDTGHADPDEAAII